MNRTSIIQALIGRYKLKSYLEIGVRDSKDNFEKIEIELKESIDPSPLPESICNYVMTSDTFFYKYVKDEYDIIFIDGMHEAEQVKKDILNSIEILSNNGFIIVHDSLPLKKEYTRSYKDYLAKRGIWTGDVYRAIINVCNILEDWNIFIIDVDFGCTIITQNNDFNCFLSKRNLFEDIRDISWESYIDKKNQLLNIISYEQFEARLKP